MAVFVLPLTADNKILKAITQRAADSAAFKALSQRAAVKTLNQRLYESYCGSLRVVRPTNEPPLRNSALKLLPLLQKSRF
jgi:hypothetical protein